MCVIFIFTHSSVLEGVKIIQWKIRQHFFFLYIFMPQLRLQDRVWLMKIFLLRYFMKIKIFRDIHQLCRRQIYTLKMRPRWIRGWKVLETLCFTQERLETIIKTSKSIARAMKSHLIACKHNKHTSNPPLQFDLSKKGTKKTLPNHFTWIVVCWPHFISQTMHPEHKTTANWSCLKWVWCRKGPHFISLKQIEHKKSN